MPIVAAITGSPIVEARDPDARPVSSIHAISKGLSVHATVIRRERTVEAALVGLPVLLNYRVNIPIIAECGDYVGGPLLVSRLRDAAAVRVASQAGTPVRKSWEIVPIQTVPADRYPTPVAWRHDVPRRDIVAQLADAIVRKRLTVDKALPLAPALAAGIEKLRERRETKDEDRLNADEDLALCLGLCVWWISLL